MSAVAGAAATTRAAGARRSSRPRAPSAPRFRDEQITLAHGAGGKATQTLIEGLLVPAFARPSEARWRSSPTPGAVAASAARGSR